MKICLFGKNLTNLILSQVLIKKGISVHMYHQKKNKLAKINYNRTIGLSLENIKFLKKHDYDVCCNPILMRNGMREFTDWVTWDHPERGQHISLPYDNWDCTKWQYISGGYFLVRKDFFMKNPLDEDLIAGQAEDVEWSLRIREHAKIICNSSSYVIHIKEHRNEKIHIWDRLL